VRLQNMALAYQHSAALMSAVELDLFTAISGGRRDVASLAGALGISPTNADRLTTACVALGLVAHTPQGLVNAADVERFLVRGSPSYAGPWMLFTKPDWNAWGELTQRMRAGRETVLGSYEHFTVEDARRYHEATYSIGLGAGRRFARTVDLSHKTRLLDIGGGSGCYSIVAAQAHPHLRATVFDLPPVAEVAREFIARHGVADRVEAMGGDFTRDAFPPGNDIAIMASNLPQYSPAIIRQVVAKAFGALLPGGQFHLLGEMLRPDRSGPVSPALWGLNEAIGGSTGVAHTEDECIAYLREAGFVDVAVHPFIEGTLSRVTGTRP
jgi:SAM-dependent methyltransferase